MSNYGSPLNNIKIASPCPADWESMYGNERMRFCGQCKLNVYNLSGMTRAEAESLVERAEGSICVRYFRRADGTVLTQDCPVGWAKVKKRVSAFATAAFSLFISAFTGAYLSVRPVRQVEVGTLLPIALTTPTPDNLPIMGAIAMPTPSPKASPSPPPGQKVGRVVVIKPIDVPDDAGELREKVRETAGA